MADSQGQTPDDLDTSGDGSADTGLFDSITANVVTLAGAMLPLVKSQNSPYPNNAPSNVPSTVPTAPASKTSMFAGWSTAKKIGVGAAAVVVVILGFLGLGSLLKRR